MASGPVSPLLLERYELKYLIPFSMVQPISDYVSAFCELDYYSQIEPDNFYLINSLYFESPTFHFMRAKENDTAKFSLRVRSYGNEPKAPYFFETKEKVAEFCKKRRGKVNLENWSDIFLNPNNLGDFDISRDKHLEHFLNQALYYNAHPMILSQYRRKAYLSTIDDYARVTFDKSLRFMRETNYNVKPVESMMTSYDHCDSFNDPGSNVILELKCERKVPVWIVNLIQKFQLTRRGFSKFESSMLEAYSLKPNEALTFDRIPGY
ncbi:MAG: polyphosphate polymerase domain-containing protein [Bdellovibrionota bacterium]